MSAYGMDDLEYEFGSAFWFAWRDYEDGRMLAATPRQGPDVAIVRADPGSLGDALRAIRDRDAARG